MKFVTSIVGGKAPGDGAALSIPLGLQDGDALAQVLHTLHTTPARKRLNEEKQISRAQPLILVIDARCLPRLHRLGRPHVRLGRDEFFVKADRGIAWIVLLFVEVQHIFHRRDKLRSYSWD